MSPTANKGRMFSPDGTKVTLLCPDRKGAMQTYHRLVLALDSGIFEDIAVALSDHATCLSVLAIGQPASKDMESWFHSFDDALVELRRVETHSMETVLKAAEDGLAAVVIWCHTTGPTIEMPEPRSHGRIVLEAQKALRSQMSQIGRCTTSLSMQRASTWARIRDGMHSPTHESGAPWLLTNLFRSLLGV